MLEIAEREAIAISVGCPHLAFHCVVYSALWLVCGGVPCQDRFIWCGRQVGARWLVASPSAIGVLTPSNVVPRTEVSVRAFVQAFVFAVSSPRSGLLAVLCVAVVHRLLRL